MSESFSSPVHADQLIDMLSRSQPRLIHISGKTCTGKSTLAERLRQDFDYHVVSLDQVVNDAVIEPLALQDRGSVFVEVYRNRDVLEWIELFVAAVQKHVRTLLNDERSVVVDGAVANMTTLAELFDPFDRYLFVYLHPMDDDRYRSNIRSRFELATSDYASGLPRRFWQMVDDGEFAAFCETRVLTAGLIDSIRRYAHSSRLESERRLMALRAAFDNVVEVNV